jgi:SAM-dependent methyltransferase
MNFLVRPSKSFLFDILEKELKSADFGVGLDAAAAGMKNRHMFKTDMYVGLDINQAQLEAGLKKYRDAETIGLCGDITNLNGIPSNSIDVVASTNTLYVLPAKKRILAIKELSRITAPQGTFICEVFLTDNFNEELKLLESNFKYIKKMYYKNIVSYTYEHFFERNGNLGFHSIASLLPFRIFSWLLSRLEYLTCLFRPLNRHALLICRDKKTDSQKQKFDFKNLHKISDRLYSLDFLNP